MLKVSGWRGSGSSRSVFGEAVDVKVSCWRGSVVKVSGWRGSGSSRSLVGEAVEVKVSGWRGSSGKGQWLGRL